VCGIRASGANARINVMIVGDLILRRRETGRRRQEQLSGFARFSVRCQCLRRRTICNE
jgi:hypothetical protein